MVVVPDDTTGIEGQCVHAIMDGEVLMMPRENG